MAWIKEDEYIRDLLDKRERWGVVLSLTAVAGLFIFLSDHPNTYSSLVNLAPFLIGAFGSLFILVVDCYYEQAKAISNALSKNNEDEASRHKDNRWYIYIRSIGFLGWLHILAPIVIGALATLTLYCGISVAHAESFNKKDCTSPPP